MELPPKKYVCEKCGYLGNTSEHEGCDYLAWTTGEQLYIDQLERELALLKASPASASVAAPDYRIADRGFRWDAENRQHIPQLLIEFTPVPENAPNASSGWKDRDKLAAMLVAAPTPPVSEDRKDAERFREGWTHACNALCMEIALWIERCPHCGMPAPKAPAMQEDKQ